MTKSIEMMQNYRQFKVILDKALTEKAINYTQQNEMKLTGLLRLALKDFFESKETSSKNKKLIVKSGKKWF